MAVKKKKATTKKVARKRRVVLESAILDTSTFARNSVAVDQLMDHGFSHSAIRSSLIDGQFDTADDADVVTAVKLVASPKKVSGAHAAVVAKVKTFKTPMDMAKSFIASKYRALGGARGFLQKATTAVQPCPDRRGYFQHFQGGSIYWHPMSGVHEVHGAIRAKWKQLGWERGMLGYPTSDEKVGKDREGRGRVSHFQNGSIYWYPGVGTFEVHGAIRIKYHALGAESSFLGYPTTNERATPDRVGRFNHFQAGSIYWTPRTGAHEVHGLIRALWASLGWERNVEIGYPISDELIPHRKMGHSRPVPNRKPIAGLPADVIRFPADATPRGITGIDSVSFARADEDGAGFAFGELEAAAAESLSSSISIRGFDSQLSLANPSQTSGGQSDNRFGDFQNAVLFWARGSRSATQLTPLRSSVSGTRLYWTAADVVALSTPRIRAALARVNPPVTAIQFSGTTRYRYDGAGVHNRNHRMRVSQVGTRRVGPVTVPASAHIEIQVEVAYDPLDRKVFAYYTDWSFSRSQYGPAESEIARCLDPLMWTRFVLTPVPARYRNQPLTVLSVKTMTNGEVNTYVEPNMPMLGVAVSLPHLST